MYKEIYGRQIGEREGVLKTCPLERDVLPFESESEVRSGTSMSALLINCNGVNGDPAEEIDLRECGLPLFGVDKINEGISGMPDSGVFGRSGLKLLSLLELRANDDLGIDWNKSEK